MRNFSLAKPSWINSFSSEGKHETQNSSKIYIKKKETRQKGKGENSRMKKEKKIDGRRRAKRMNGYTNGKEEKENKKKTEEG